MTSELVPVRDTAVSAEAALAFVRTARKQGGLARLIATGVLIPFTAACWLAAGHGLVALLAIASTALLVRNLKQGLRSHEVSAQIVIASQLPAPLSAMVVDHELLVGRDGAPRATWCRIPITVKQEQHIRTLALPAARVVRDGDP